MGRRFCSFFLFLFYVRNCFFFFFFVCFFLLLLVFCVLNVTSTDEDGPQKNSSACPKISFLCVATYVRVLLPGFNVSPPTLAGRTYRPHDDRNMIDTWYVTCNHIIPSIGKGDGGRGYEYSEKSKL